ncbi:MAG: carboxymuconolactone decarboxylase family protein [Myxococcota bacterium]
MRLQPIEKPPGPLMRFAYWMSRRQLGTVASPLKVVYARVPALARLTYQMARTEEQKLTLEPGLALLIHARTSELNGCGFCVDIARAKAVTQHIGLEKFQALADYRTSPLFDDRERAALAYAEEVTREKRVDDATFERLRKHFNEREIVEVTWVNALANYYNLINVPLELEADGLCAIAQRRARA